MYLRIIYNEKKTLKEKNLKKEQFFCDLFFSFLERERGGRVGTGRKEEGREERRWVCLIWSIYLGQFHAHPLLPLPSPLSGTGQIT